MSVSDYKVVRGVTPRDLVIAVREAIEQGWEPQGGLVLGDGIYYQAMIKPTPTVYLGPM